MGDSVESQRVDYQKSIYVDFHLKCSYWSFHYWSTLFATFYGGSEDLILQLLSFSHPWPIGEKSGTLRLASFSLKRSFTSSLGVAKNSPGTKYTKTRTLKKYRKPKTKTNNFESIAIYWLTHSLCCK